MKRCSMFYAGILQAVLFCCLSAGCKLSTPAISLITGDFTSPKLISVEVLNERELLLSFTKPVKPALFAVCPEGGTAMAAEYEVTDETAVRVNLLAPSEVGKTYVLEGSVADSNGNELSFLTEFSGYNSRVPKLVLSEVRTEYAKPKVEFIELYAQTAGNIGGVLVYNSHNGEEAAYEFPAAEVCAGEYIVLHLRTIEENTVDETEALDVSGGTEAFDYARDFWEANTASRLSKNCVILLRERKNGSLLDALLLTESKNAAWTKTAHADAAKLAFESGVWQGGAEPACALVADGLTATRTASRQGDLQSASSASKTDWLVVATSNATPGKANSNKPYVPK